jgi:hypothetical protein
MRSNRPARGTEGILIRVSDDIVFRVYHENGEFTDFDIAHSDMAITITDPDAWFYEKSNENTAAIDHSPQTLGIEGYVVMDETEECCEGGPMTAGCYHDHCTGPKEKNT